VTLFRRREKALPGGSDAAPSPADRVPATQQDPELLRVVLDLWPHELLAVDGHAFVTQVNRAFEESRKMPADRATGCHVMELVSDPRNTHPILWTGIPEFVARQAHGLGERVPGGSIRLAATLSGSDDLTVDGPFEGRIDLPDNVLVVGRNGEVRAAVSARCVVVFGHVVGDIIAGEKVEVGRTGSVEGDIRAPRVTIVEGACVAGRVDMAPAFDQDSACLPAVKR
jgi:cytoskeletal protein CcmA (bactofilin family)